MRRIWSEFVPYEELASASLATALRERSIELLIAVTPDRFGDLPRVVEHFETRGIDYGLWPMLDDDQGRWASTFTAEEFSLFCRSVADVSTVAKTMVIDVEPPLHITRDILHGNKRALAKLLSNPTRRFGRGVLQLLVEELSSQGWHCLAAVPPVLLADAGRDKGWQWLFGTPVNALPFATLSAMSYTSLMEGYSRGLLSRKHSLELLFASAQRARSQWQSRASLSLGCVGVGAIGDERCYRGPAELAEDVAIAKLGGVDDLALFNLGGILEGGELETWLDAFVRDLPRQNQPRLGLRSRSILGALGGGSQLLRVAQGAYESLTKPSSDVSSR